VLTGRLIPKTLSLLLYPKFFGFTLKIEKNDP